MFEFKALSRYSKKNTNHLWYIFLLGLFSSFILLLAYRDILAALTIFVCTIILYILLSKEQKEINVRLNYDGIHIDTQFIAWQNCIYWAIVDLDEIAEIVIKTNQLKQSFYYFYLSSDQQELLESVILELSQYLPYQENIVQENKVHNLLRNLGLK